MMNAYPPLPRSDAVTLEAHWVFPAEGLPLPQGTVTIQNGRIVAVEAAGARQADLDLGHVALLPGFVNAHTHLDLSDSPFIPPTGSPTDWLKHVIRHRRGQSAEAKQLAVRKGLNQLLHSGTTLVGDISGDGGSWDLLQAAPLRSVVFFEMLGLSQTRAADSFALAQQWLQGRSRAGVSPHAPYSVSLDLFQKAAALDARSAIHLAEFAEEKVLLEHRQGPFVDFLHELGVWEPSAPAANWDEILQLPWSKPPLWIHANHLPAMTNLPGSIVYCPRTHAAFGHPHHPFWAFADRGINVALGTDSLASNPDLSILAEARWLHADRGDLPGELLLRMMTLHGAGPGFGRRDWQPDSRQVGRHGRPASTRPRIGGSLSSALGK